MEEEVIPFHSNEESGVLLPYLYVKELGQRKVIKARDDKGRAIFNEEKESSYKTWKNQNQHLFLGERSTDMLSNLGKRLVNHNRVYDNWKGEGEKVIGLNESTNELPKAVSPPLMEEELGTPPANTSSPLFTDQERLSTSFVPVNNSNQDCSGGKPKRPFTSPKFMMTSADEKNHFCSPHGMSKANGNVIASNKKCILPSQYALANETKFESNQECPRFSKPHVKHHPYHEAHMRCMNEQMYLASPHCERQSCNVKYCTARSNEKCCSGCYRTHFPVGVHNGYGENDEYEVDYQVKFCSCENCNPKKTRRSCNGKTHRSPLNKITPHHVDKRPPSHLSIKNLYRIVWLQNEQLALLQQQVDKVMDMMKKLNSVCNISSINSEESGKKYEENFKDLPPTINLDKKQESEKTSVGVMTSFASHCEDYIRNSFCTSCGLNKIVKSDSSLVITSSNESSNECIDQLSDERLNTEDVLLSTERIEIPILPEQTLTPQTSFHLNMREFSSEASSSDEQQGESDLEGEVYNEEPLRNEVVDFMENHKRDLKTFGEIGFNSSDDMEYIRNATFEQLRCLGISLFEQENQGHKRVTFDPVHYKRFDLKTQHKQMQSDSDTSTHINALAMKYLKEGSSAVGDVTHGMALCNIAGGTTNLSFATLRYLERYQLVPGSKKGKERRIKGNRGMRGSEEMGKGEGRRQGEIVEESRSPTIGKNTRRPPSKILDVPAIKRQPKLLPKI